MEERKKQKGRRKCMAGMLMLLLAAVMILQAPLQARAEEEENRSTDVLIGISAELTTETTIKVVDESKKPIKNARLSMYVKAGDYTGFLPLGVTLADGSYTIKLPHGTYRCKVEASGYESTEGEFTLSSSDKKQTVNITLKEKAKEPVKEEEQLLTVAVIAKFTNGSPAAGYGAELHSKVQKGILDGNGYGVFNNVELGEHSLYLFDIKGKEAASADFVLAKSDAVKLEGKDMVKVGVDTQMLTIDLEIDPETGAVNLTDAREGLYRPASVGTGTPSITKFQREIIRTRQTIVKTERAERPKTKAGMAKTGDDMADMLPVYISMILAAAVGMMGTGMARRKKK